MAIIKEATSPVFDTKEIKKADLVRAQYYSWYEPVNGIITKVTPHELTVLYLPKIHNACSYFSIYAHEVAAGKWQIKTTGDLETISEVGKTYEGPNKRPRPDTGGADTSASDPQ